MATVKVIRCRVHTVTTQPPVKAAAGPVRQPTGQVCTGSPARMRAR
jgi:hypothetical protein